MKINSHSRLLIAYAILLFISVFCNQAAAQKADYAATTSTSADKIEQKVIGWRHDIHEHPVLGNREFRTAALIASHLQSLGNEVKTNVGVTGVVGILKVKMCKLILIISIIAFHLCT